ncbi:tetratricopeptide repeat protein [Celeribacter sp.]|uniref:tetratricopeptide repeat protein n=1 Tax=Celeribacter sp. TaxID=1890673 RepID=UPI003A90C21E
MRPEQRIGVVGTVGALCVAVLATWAFAAERTAFASYRSNPDEAFAELRRRADHPVVALSALSRERAVEMCSEALIAPLSFAFPPDEKRAVAQRCEVIAARVVDASPAWGLAWFAQARAQFELGKVAEAVESLRRSARLAPNEGWIAQKRVLLGRDLLRTPSLDAPDMLAEVTDDLHADLTLLFSQYATITWIAQLYAVAPDFKPVIADVAEQQDDATRARFLRQVRNAMNGRRI